MLARLAKQPRALTAICLGWMLGVTVLHIFLARYRNLEWKARDQLVRFGSRSELHPQIVFLAIDNASITLDLLMEDERKQSPALSLMENGFPYPRTVYPLIIERLVQAGARVVVFDMLFPSEKETDGPFREALAKYADQVVIGANLEARDQGAAGGHERLHHTLVPPATSLIPPVPGMDDRLGFVNFWGDPDDKVVRRALYRTTSEEMVGLPFRKAAPELFSLSARAVQKAGQLDRVPATHEMTLPRFAQQIRPHSLYEIFVRKFWDIPPYNGGELFRDKIVLIGPDGNWVKDELLTAFGLTTGPRLHISAMNAALKGDFLSEPSEWTNLLCIFAAGACAWLLGGLVQRRLLRLVILFGVAVSSYGAAQLLFNLQGFLPIVLSPLVALIGSSLTWTVREQVLDRVERLRMRRTLERYVSQDIVRELLDNPESYLNSIGGVRKEITVLFSDVRGFTSMTENADPHALVAQLNEYFEGMVATVFANQGTLDKFMGDAVMAHWGSIVGEGAEIDAVRAVTTALQMRTALARLNAAWKERGIVELQIGIGVSHGPAIVGNIGCEAKMEVSVIGDAVNLGSRLEGTTKQYHLDLCISETAAALVRESFIVRSVDLIVVKGKTKPVGVFTILEKRGPGVTEPAWLARHEEAVQFYRTGAFSAAEKAWRDVLEQAPTDGVAQVFIERCVELQKHPPEAEWTGVYEMKSK